jgi:membrane peptidoglycan carboxypeptidase
VSNNDFNGPDRSARGRGADAGKYPEPEGWKDDGFWRDPSIDSDYETGMTGAVRPARDDSGRGAPGYSYWADGKGWENSPGTAKAQPASKAQPAGESPANGLGAGRSPRAGAPGGGVRGNGAAGNGVPGNGSPANGAGGQYGPGGEPTAYYGAAGPGGPAGPGSPGGPGRGGPPWGPGGPGGPRGPRPRNGKVKGSWWRHWTWKKVLGIIGAAGAFVILLVVGAYFYAYNSVQIPTELAANVTAQNSTVYYSDGKTPIGTIGPINRQILTYNQIPKTVQDAVIAAEDRSFWTEGGISPTGIFRAAYDDLTSSGGNLSGGSTITQEFVRQYYSNIGTQQTVSRKLKEIFVAQKLAKSESKQWILTNYLNTIYLGDNSYGIAAAAQTYFGVPVNKLTVAQAAVIAAIIQQPSTYPLPQYRSELEARWRTYVLNGMVKIGDLTQSQADSMSFPKMLTDTQSNASKAEAAGTTSSSDPWAPYIMNVVYNELTNPQGDDVPVQTLETGGLKIITTISRPTEVAMYDAVNQNIAAIKASGYSLPSYALIGAELQNPNTGAIVGMYPGRGQNMSAKQCQIYDCDLNTAVYSREQVGSSFKPYVLATAVSEGMNVQTSTLNASPTLYVPPDFDPLVLSTTDPAKAVPESFQVSNDGGETITGTKAGGATTVQNALAQSSNTAYTDLAHRAGTRAIIQMAANMGVNIAAFPNGSNLSQLVGQVGMALGTGSLTVNEQATMLSTIDDGGMYHEAHIIQSWQAPEGAVQLAKVAQHQVLSQNLDSQVQYAMEMTTVDGTGVQASLGPDRPILGKTGTTTNSKAAFFIGAIPQWSFVVGIFTEQQNANSPETLTALGGGGFGGTWPANIWHTFMSQLTSNLPVQQFLSPVFTGQAWNQVGNVPAKKKKTTPTCKHQFRLTNCTNPGQGNGGGNPQPTPSDTTPSGFPTFPNGPASPTDTPTATDTATGNGPGGGGGPGGG